MAYPANFDFTILKSLKSFKSKLEYVKSILPKIGQGSSREIYKVDDEKVLKVAKNKKGILQNESEGDWYKQYYSIVAKVFDSDDDNYFIEMELAKKVTDKRFEELVGISLTDLKYFLNKMILLDNGKIKESSLNADIIYTKVKQNEFATDLHELLNSTDCLETYLIPDYTIKTAYGEVVGNNEPKIVLVDFGYNKSSYKLYKK